MSVARDLLGGFALVLLTALSAGCAPQAPAASASADILIEPTALPTLAPELQAVRTALDRFRDPIVAIREGYLSTMGCVDYRLGGTEGQMAYMPGAMGVHFLNPAYIGPTLDAMRPQVLLYEWAGDKLRLTGVEWFMPVAVSATAPSLLGRPLDGPMEGHEPILPAELHHWDLHAWLWKENPNGLFHPTNSAVHCPPGVYTFELHTPKMVHAAH